jgi:hypothetical protein
MLGKCSRVGFAQITPLPARIEAAMVTLCAYLRTGVHPKNANRPYLFAGLRALALTPFAYAQGRITFKPAGRASGTAATPLESHASLCPSPGRLRDWDTALIKFALVARLKLQQLTDTERSFPLIAAALEKFHCNKDWVSGRLLFMGAFVRLNYRASELYNNNQYEAFTFGDPSGPTAVDDGMLARPSCNTFCFQSLPQDRKGLVELFLFHAPSKAFGQFVFFNYLETIEMARLVTISSSVHEGLMNTVTTFSYESRTAFDLLLCHFKAVNLLRWGGEKSSLESHLGRYVREGGATPFSDWLEQRTKEACRERWFYDVTTRESVQIVTVFDGEVFDNTFDIGVAS